MIIISFKEMTAVKVKGVLSEKKQCASVVSAVIHTTTNAMFPGSCHVNTYFTLNV